MFTLHVYVAPPPLAVNDVDEPAHIVELAAVSVKTDGFGIITPVRGNVVPALSVTDKE